MIDTVLIVLGGICMIAGLIGCFLPVLPGPPISYVGLLLLHLTSKYSFSTKFLFLYAVLTIVVTVVDYILPAYTTKKARGSKYGIWGSTAGMVIGLIFFPPFGVIIGPVLGAFVGEVVTGKNAGQAMTAAVGSFLGFLAGTGIKLVVSGMMTYYFFKSVL